MKLNECKIGEIVQIAEECRVGHIVGLTYDISLSKLINYNYSHAELQERIIPLVKFVDCDLPCGIHHNNLTKVNW